MQKERIIGTSALRKEGIAKVRGTARYIDDTSFPDMLFGATIVSRAADHQVRLAAMLSIRRARILGWVLERLRNQRPPEPAITLFYPPTIQREAEESTA